MTTLVPAAAPPLTGGSCYLRSTGGETAPASDELRLPLWTGRAISQKAAA